MKSHFPNCAKITQQTAGKKEPDKRLLWKRCSLNHKCICKQKITDIKLPFILFSVGIPIHKTQTAAIPSQLTEDGSWGIFHPLTGLSLFMSKIMMVWLLCANWKPTGRCCGKLLAHTHEPAIKAVYSVEPGMSCVCDSQNRAVGIMQEQHCGERFSFTLFREKGILFCPRVQGVW